MSDDMERPEIELLLPWYATGRLSPGEHARVEAALARDPALRRQASLARAELDGAVALNEAIAPPRTAGLDAIMAKIAAEDGPSRAAGWFARLKAAFEGPQRGPLRFAAMAAALVLCVQGAAITALVVERFGGGYGIAGGPGDPQGAGALALARFADGASAAAIAEVLGALEITIVDGPKPGGIFTLRLGDAEMSAEAREKKLSDLKARAGLVTFAEPAP
jgi:anti-sigma factor RsiW